MRYSETDKDCGLYLVRPLLSWPGSGGKNLTINLKNRSFVSDGNKKTKQEKALFTCTVNQMAMLRDAP